jgi:hypothetical protein
LQRQKSRRLSPPRKPISCEKYTKSRAKKRDSAMERSLELRKSTLLVPPRFPLHLTKERRHHTTQSPFVPRLIPRQRGCPNLEFRKYNDLLHDHKVRNLLSPSWIYKTIHLTRVPCHLRNVKRRRLRNPIRLITSSIIRIYINSNIILSF